MEYSCQHMKRYTCSIICLLASISSHNLAADSSHHSETIGSVSSKARAFAKSAELEFAKFNDAGLQSGISLCEQATNDPSFRRLQIEERLWIYKMLSSAYQKNRAFAKQESLLLSLIDDIQFRPFVVELKSHLGLSYIAQERTIDAEKLLKSMTSHSMRKLAFQDAEEIALLYSRIEQYYEKKLASAERRFQAKNYGLAAHDFACVYEAAMRKSLTHTLSTRSQSEFLSSLRFRLAQSHYLSANYKAAIQVASTEEHPVLKYQALLIQGYAYKQQGMYDMALATFQQYLQCPSLLAYNHEAMLDATFCAIKLGKTNLARKTLEDLQKEPINSTLFRRKKAVQIFLEIDDKNYNLAESLLSQYESTLNASSFFTRLECQYLRGYLAYKKREFDKAIFHLEHSIRDASADSFDWQADALYLLGLCACEVGKYQVAEEYFELIEANELWAEKSVLGLARTYFTQGAQNKLETLIARCEMLQSPECIYEIRLMLACLTNSFVDILQDKYKERDLYPKALVLSTNNKETLSTAFQLLKDRKLLDTEFALVHQIIQSLLAQGEAERALMLVDSIIPELSNVALKEEAEFLYARCFFGCTRRGKLDPGQLVVLINRFITNYPDSCFKPDILHLKGLTFLQKNEPEKAKEIFALLESEHKGYTRRDEVLFFLAVLTTENAPIFQELYAQFPESAFAHEAYFRAFPESAYKQQDIHAIAHLKKMNNASLHTIYGVLCSIYIAQAIRQECPEKSLSPSQQKLLQEAIYRYDLAIQNGEKLVSKLPPKLSSFLQCRLLEATLERAQSLFILANTGTRSQSAFDELRQSLDALQSQIKININTDRQHLLSLWQEAALQKSRIYLLQGEEKQAREELANLVEYMRQENFEMGDGLVKALCQLAVFYTREGAIEQADYMLNKAQVVQAKGASHELLLEIYITKSGLHRKKEEYDRAMILLSSVINDTSASSLRIQAMYLRAELYELKGRRDLALRQLQATAKKGGEWGTMARKKLEEQYGYE